MNATAFAPINIALLKYWGKRNSELNLPTHNSLSVTLNSDELGCQTTVEWGDFDDDCILINGLNESKTNSFRVIIDYFRNLSGTKLKTKINSTSKTPISVGLASSASGMAAITHAASAALNLDLNAKQLSQIARLGSGSASRSFFDGFVSLYKGTSADGSDCYAETVFPSNHYSLNVTVLILETKEKPTTSRKGMILAQNTSPLFTNWVQYCDSIYQEFINAISNKNFEKLAFLTEQNCRAMHATANTSNPAIQFWNQNTFYITQLIPHLRQKGMAVFFTIDAGANVVLFSLPQDTLTLENEIKNNISNIKTISAKIGVGSYLIDHKS